MPHASRHRIGFAKGCVAARRLTSHRGGIEYHPGQPKTSPCSDFARTNPHRVRAPMHATPPPRPPIRLRPLTLPVRRVPRRLRRVPRRLRRLHRRLRQSNRRTTQRLAVPFLAWRTWVRVFRRSFAPRNTPAVTQRSVSSTPDHAKHGSVNHATARPSEPATPLSSPASMMPPAPCGKTASSVFGFTHPTPARDLSSATPSTGTKPTFSSASIRIGTMTDNAQSRPNCQIKSKPTSNDK